MNSLTILQVLLLWLKISSFLRRKCVKEKIARGVVNGLDKVIVAREPEFNSLVKSLKELILEEPSIVKVIESSQVITSAKVRSAFT